MKRLWILMAIVAGSTAMRAQGIAAYTADDIVKRASSKDTTYIINFWATWCGPCVAELPEFNKLYSYYEGKPVKILMVSLDFKQDYPDKLGVFLQRKKLKPEVVWLADSDPNIFIPKLENKWEGSIPATLIVSPGKNYRKFMEGSITKQEVADNTPMP